MKNLFSLALRFEQGSLYVLNQQKLPTIEEWVICHTPNDMVECIQTLKVRGAPLIGIAAALSLAQFVEKGASPAEIKKVAHLLKEARPTAVNLSYCILEQLKAYEQAQDPKAIINTAEKLFEEDARLSESIALH